MRKILIISCIFYLLPFLFSCRLQTHRLQKSIEEETFEIIDYIGDNRHIRFSYENFPNSYLNEYSKYSNVNLMETYQDSGDREGSLLYGLKEGLWTCVSINNKINLEEYFKKGLRDSIYRVFNHNIDTILYETIFNMGTGLVKDFHSNGQLYYEIQTKDGYFTDTLRLYNEEGILSEKLFYDRDSLVFYEKKSNSGEWEIQPRYILDERNKNR